MSTMSDSRPSKRERMAWLMNGTTLLLALGAYGVMAYTQDAGISTAAAGVSASGFGALGYVKKNYIQSETSRPSGTG
jgi:hypothetical protein